MPLINTNNLTSLIYPELSYEIVGLIYNVFNDLGYGFQEKYYQRAFAEELKKNNYLFKREQKISIKYNDKIIGRYFVDFIINDKMIVEFKVASGFYEDHINQVLAYLKSSNLKLGLLILITKGGIRYKRLVN